MKTVIRREFLDHVRSLQFMTLLMLAMVLFVASSLIFVASNAQKTETYQKKIGMLQQEKSTIIAMLPRRPNPLQFIADGGDRDKPSDYMLLPKGTMWAGEPNRRTFKLPVVPPLDWSFIIGALFSLYVILLGYNAISGEREDGTLRLVLSNPVGRARLLTAKYLSIIFAVVAPLLAGALTSLIIIGILAPQILIFSTISRIGLVLVISLAYISLFAFLSLLFSAMIPRSSIALLMLLTVWVLFVVIIPCTSLVLMEKLSSAPREIQTARMLQPMLEKEFSAVLEEIDKKAKRGEFKTEEEVRTAADKTFEDSQDKINQFFEEFDRNQQQRARTAQNLSRLSPSALFKYATESLIQSGTLGEDTFLQQLRDYSKAFDAYILKKLGKVVRSSEFMFEGAVTFNGKMLSIRSPEPQEYRGDKSDFPLFVERQLSLGAGLRSALLDMAGLLIWNILLAGLAFSAFIRADVR